METKMSTIAIERSATAGEITSRARVGRKELALAGLAVAITLGGIGYGRYWWETERFIASTDDAYASGNVTAVAPPVAGLLAAILVCCTQTLQARPMPISSPRSLISATPRSAPRSTVISATARRRSALMSRAAHTC